MCHTYIRPVILMLYAHHIHQSYAVHILVMCVRTYVCIRPITLTWCIMGPSKASKFWGYFYYKTICPSKQNNVKRRITIFTIQLSVTKLLNTSACTEMYMAENASINPQNNWFMRVIPRTGKNILQWYCCKWKIKHIPCISLITFSASH